ncbi:MAG: hypothetical protein IJ313_07265 [Clostridia bacterium]|nr:hypothetical protein [Clostridia bacterium]
MLSVWSLRRVLLAGESCAMLRAMQAQLCTAGARPLCYSAPFGEESLCRALHQGRFCCVIVPSLPDLCPGESCNRLAALSVLLSEAREAGVPLVMLLSGSHDDETAQLFSHALGCASGALGDPVSVQCIRHLPGDPNGACLGALDLGARFLSGERACVGVFTLEGEAMGRLPHAPTRDFDPETSIVAHRLL